MLFCPFCREAFDELERCPDHDVELVSLRELGQLSAAQVPDQERLPVWSARLGRGLVASGALGTLLAFFCSFGRLVDGSAGGEEISSTLLSLARGRALRLWIVPTAAFALLWMLYRRRTPVAMRAARVGALFVACLPSAVVAFTWLGARAAAAAMAGKTAGPVVFHLGIGAFLVFGSGVLAVLGSLRLGVKPSSRIR